MAHYDKSNFLTWNARTTRLWMFREILYVVLRTVGFSVQNLPNAYNYISAFKALILAYEKIQMKALREFIEQVQGGKRRIFNSAEYRLLTKIQMD